MATTLVAVVAVVAVVAMVTAVAMVAVAAAPVAGVVFVYGARAEGEAAKKQHGQNATEEEGRHGERILGKWKRKLRMFLVKRQPKKLS